MRYDKLSVVFHTFGLSCLIGAVSTALLTFYFIMVQNYALFVEPNLFIRSFEFACMIVAAVYLVFLVYLFRKKRCFVGGEV